MRRGYVEALAVQETIQRRKEENGFSDYQGNA